MEAAKRGQRNMVIKGFVQMGKTKYYTNIALYFIYMKRMSVCIIFNNYQIDIKTWINRLSMLIATSLKEMALPGPHSEEETVNHLLDILLSRSGDQQKRKISTILCNVSSMKKFQKGLKRRRMLYIVDESDALAVNPVREKRIAQRRTLITTLFNNRRCWGTIRVTATLQSHYVVEDFTPVYCKQISILPYNRDHVTFGHMLFRLNPLENYMSLGNKGVLSDPAKEEICEIINKEISISKKLKRVPVGYIVLSRITQKHNYVANAVAKFFPKTTFIIVNNGFVRISYPGGNPHPKRVIREREQQTLQENLYHLQKERHSMIIIIGCAMISRGQSLRSEVPQFQSYRDVIYAQFCIISVSQTKDNSNLIQTVLRAGGIFPQQDHLFDGIRVYTDQNVINNIRATLEWDVQCINNILLPENGEKDVRTVLPPLMEDLYFDTQDSNDKLRKMAKYAPPKVCDGDFTYLTTESYNPRDPVIEELDEHEKYFRIWSRPRCKLMISRVLKNIDPNKVYRMSLFKKFIQCTTNTKNVETFIHNMTRPHSRNGNGTLLVIKSQGGNATGGTVQFNPQLVGVYKKWFKGEGDH